MKRRLMTLLAMTLTISLITAYGNLILPIKGNSEQHPANSMWIEPSIIDISGMSVGDRFNVTVWVNVTVDCAGWQFAMLYDTRYLNATRAGYTGSDGTTSQFFEQSGTASMMPLTPTLYNQYNETHNYVLHGEVWSPMIPNNPYATGTGSLSWIEFQIIAQPPEGGEIRTILDIKTLYPTKTYITDSTQTKIELNLYDSLYVFQSPTAPPPPPEVARIYVNPPEIVDPTLKPCLTFSINITVEKVADLKIVEFNLTYNPTVIGWESMSALRVQNQTPTVMSMIDDKNGFIWLKLQYPASISTDIPLDLIRIGFHIESYGATPLDLQDTLLLDSLNQPIEHETTDGFFSTLIRDIAITNVTPSREWAYAGWIINITVTIKNEGNTNETFNVRTYYNNNLLDEITITNLTPSEERNILFQWNTTGISDGNYTIRAEADILPDEIDTADNSFTDGTILIMTKVHDISITELNVPDIVYQGWIVNLTVTVKNKGDLPETFELEAYYNGNLIESITITNLAPTNESIVTFTWNTTEVTPCRNYTITVKTSLIPYELNITDNTAICNVKVRYMGDVNGDGMVDVMDILSVAESYGAYPTSSRWNPHYDLDQNLIIDILDILIIATNYGKGCP